ncbi:GGDEF domain-containing protein [Breznakiella homolactica]|uniref:diguanylate cyclase n=1 Tax=Breznakiella homolactica TaxID=2798577 RepID=A0A7T8BC70_9SPIR|nr:GGDEF domain-containing protein [Breznakiella homolactica]QQO09918.1 GGDEF domain-containing protein [Breznakiella homolactica]
MINIDVKTQVAILFWGNLTSVALILSFELSSIHSRDRRLAIRYILAKLFQAVAYLFIFQRDAISSYISVNLGNTLMMAGFYIEAIAMLIIINEDCKSLRWIEAIITAVSIIAFNLIELFSPNISFRVAVSSLGLFLIMVIPTFQLFFSKNTTRFKRIVGVYYLFFIILLLPRGVFAVVHGNVEIFSNYVIQSLTFLSLVLLMIFSLSAYLLLMKENSDRIITYMATMDLMTDISNRQNFLNGAGILFGDYKRAKKNIALLFFDVDHFKKINDTFGHSFGDEVLKRFAEAIKNSMRPEDLSCRYGGEEFLSFLQIQDAATARKIASRVMEEIKDLTFEGKPDFSFTTSIGIALGIPAGNQTLDDYINRADEALYEAKRTGRNKIVEMEMPPDTDKS